MDELKVSVDRVLKELDLHPLEDPCGEHGHHTEVAFTQEDKNVAQLAYYLGTVFDSWLDCPSCPCMQISSEELWMRVARALRVHGLQIVTKKEEQHEHR